MAKKIKILATFPTFFPAQYWGGPIFSSYFTCIELKNNPLVDLKILTTNSSGPKISDKLSNKEIQVVKKELDIDFAAKTFGKSISLSLAIRILREARHSHVIWITSIFSFPVLISAFAAKFHNKPVIITPRGSLQVHEKSRKIFLKKFYIKLLAILLHKQDLLMHFTSEQESLQSLVVRKSFKSMILRNGVELPKLSLEDRLERSKNHYKRSDDKLLNILYLGRIDKKKGIELLLTVLSKLNRKYFLKIVGDGEQKYVKKILDDANRTLGKANFKYFGALHEKKKDDAFYSSDILILPSYSENFGIVIAESLIRGVPVICSNNTPWVEIISKNAGWCTNNDEGELIDLLEKMDLSDLAKKAENGLNWMENSFLWSDIANEFSIEVEKFVHKKK